MSALRRELPSFATPSNPLDVTGGAMLKPELVTQAITTVSQDPNIGLVSVVFDCPLKEDPSGFARSFVKAIGAGVTASKKPALMISNTSTFVSPEARALAEDHGVSYSGAGVRHGLTALGHLFRWSGNLRSSVRPTEVIPVTTRPRSERDVLEHLAGYGLAVVPGVVVASADEAVAAAREIAGPVALKIASAEIQHKTEVGGVVLKVTGDAAVREAHDAIRSRVATARPDAKIDGVIVSPMRDRGVELFVGTMRDPQWGPVIAVGLGGIFVEALKDTSLRLLPVTDDEALEMLDSLRGKVLLDGLRGAPVVDRKAAAKAIVAIGNAALALGPDLVSLEINPLLVQGDRVEALDGLTVWEE
jgi:acyl-CoA synthetase (NDP forming)